MSRHTRKGGFWRVRFENRPSNVTDVQNCHILRVPVADYRKTNMADKHVHVYGYPSWQTVLFGNP